MLADADYLLLIFADILLNPSQPPFIIRGGRRSYWLQVVGCFRLRRAPEAHPP